ncbi:MAG: hypothetical protein HQL80_00220 [Magnetococcales bacterium]|nr:hypothetical protein [Magnetococcales bacterium]MBF0582638.1 hypothetical protein [Magnetococcales bacterium]
MTCAVDDILNESSKTVQGTMEHMVQELATDFNLDLNTERLLAAPEAAKLRGALQTFAVWVVQRGSQ